MSFKKKLKKGVKKIRKGGKKALETATIVALAPVAIAYAAIKSKED